MANNNQQVDQETQEYQVKILKETNQELLQ